MESVQKNAVGVAIRATITEDDVAVDVSAVTTRELVFQKPDGTTETTTAVFTNTGTDGKIQYVTEAAFLDTPGVWSVQGSVVFPAGFVGRSEVGSFEVLDNI